MKVLVTGANGYIGRHVVKALLDKGADVIACDIVTNDVDERAVRKTLNLFELPEGNVYEQLGSPDVCLHMAWRNGFVHNAPTQIGDLSAHYKFLTAMIDGGLKQLAVMGTCMRLAMGRSYGMRTHLAVSHVWYCQGCASGAMIL